LQDDFFGFDFRLFAHRLRLGTSFFYNAPCGLFGATCLLEGVLPPHAVDNEGEDHSKQNDE
jgi:hypothetical protein